MIYERTIRPDRALFFRRDEPGDPRWGERISFDPKDYARAKIVLIGCPQDEGVRRNGGRAGASAAPAAIRACFYRLVATADTGLFDLGNISVQASLEETHRTLNEVVRQVLSDGKRVVVLGGGNDISYPDCSAVSAFTGTSHLLALNIDAHLDVRQNPVRHSGTPYRMLLQEGLLTPANFYEIAYQPFAVAPAHLDYVRNKGAHAIGMRELRQKGAAASLENILGASDAKGIFWGIDMDSVCAADAPGVSAPNALGLSAEELCDIATLAGADSRTTLFEITEVNPAYDVDQRTARLAAVAIHHFLRMCL
jgi:formiminoglutamase